MKVNKTYEDERRKRVYEFYSENINLGKILGETFPS